MWQLQLMHYGCRQSISQSWSTLSFLKDLICETLFGAIDEYYSHTTPSPRRILVPKHDGGMEEDGAEDLDYLITPWNIIENPKSNNSISRGKVLMTKEQLGKARGTIHPTFCVNYFFHILIFFLIPWQSLWQPPQLLPILGYLFSDFYT